MYFITVLFSLCQGGFDAGYLYECEFPSKVDTEDTPPAELFCEPVKSIWVTDSNDVPVSTIKWR